MPAGLPCYPASSSCYHPCGVRMPADLSWYPARPSRYHLQYVGLKCLLAHHVIIHIGLKCTWWFNTIIYMGLECLLVLLRYLTTPWCHHVCEVRMPAGPARTYILTCLRLVATSMRRLTTLLSSTWPRSTPPSIPPWARYWNRNSSGPV